MDEYFGACSACQEGKERHLLRCQHAARVKLCLADEHSQSRYQQSYGLRTPYHPEAEPFAVGLGILDATLRRCYQQDACGKRPHPIELMAESIWEDQSAERHGRSCGVHQLPHHESAECDSRQERLALRGYTVLHPQAVC